MKTLKDFYQILDRHTLVITLLALTSTTICRYFGIMFSIPTDLIGIAVIFPLVFSISGAFKQREDVTGAFAGLRVNIMSLYYAHRDWPRETSHRESGRQMATDLLRAVVQYFRSPVRSAEAEQHFREVYRLFSAYSEAHERLRAAGVPANEIAAANQLLNRILENFEKMNNVQLYRPPVALRAHSRMFLNLFPVIFGPYFANLAYPDYPWVGFAVAALYAIVLVSLDNVQDQLENPFDSIGADDLKLETVEEYIRLLE
ncbi:MAG TPA: bestrophin family ion channel [Anaerolineales bacterium]|nr:bestrophin family ion channel [Anaerolineales bacterium]